VPDSIDGNSVGWDPNGATLTFTITDSAVISSNQAFVSVIVDAPGTPNLFCDTVEQREGAFVVTCFSPPPNFSVLDYILVNRPSTIIQ
jgi:hypothetical protein